MYSEDRSANLLIILWMPFVKATSASSSFIHAKQQSAFHTQVKSDLLPGELLVTADFSENYSFVLQDAAQFTDNHSPFCDLL